MSHSTSYLAAIQSDAGGLTVEQATGAFVFPSESLMPQAGATANYQSYIVAQSFDQDVLGDIKSGFTNFVETGQVWALLIGLVLGFVIRGLTR